MPFVNRKPQRLALNLGFVLTLSYVSNVSACVCAYVRVCVCERAKERVCL